MEDLLFTQNQIMEAMHTLLRNFKKDGPDRKTPVDIKKRLSTLEGYWQEFQCNHIKLCEYDDKSHHYFVTDAYKRASEFYIDTRAHIQKYLPSDTKTEEKQFLRPATPLSVGGRATTSRAEAPAGQRSPVPQDTQTPRNTALGISSKLEEMLRRQKSNFKAFSRTVSGIDLDKIADKWEFEDVLRSVQSRWSVIDSLHWEIDSELYEDNYEYEQAFGRYEQQYIDIKRNINSKMWDHCHREKATPQMDIPTFTGNYQQWVSFRDLFIEAIHKSRSLSNAQKLQLLKGKLRGEPERLIQHLTISSDNYEVSWDILNHRYNNEKLIFNSHANTLMNLPSIQQQSAIAIKKIFDTTNECLNAIKALGIDINTWDPLLVYIISNKLDADTHIDYIESLQNPRQLPVLKDLLNFLENKFTSLEASKRKSESAKAQSLQPTSTNNFKKTHFFKSFTGNQTQFNSLSTKEKTAKCAVCNKDKDHSIYNCETFLEMQPSVRQNIVNKLSLCKNCLRFHGNRKCYSYKKCRECDKNHNTLLHNKVASDAEAHVSHAPNNSNNKESQLKTNVLQGQECEILLATALVQVTAADGTRHTLRALVDQGSQISLITENTAQLLAIKHKRCRALIYGIGSKENKCNGIISVTISSLHSDYNFDIDLFVTKKLIKNLPNKTFIKPSWPHIENINLADPEFNKSRSIDILLGADVYSAILLNGVIKENDFMPIAQQTRLGWILCGSANIMKSYHCNVTLIDNDDLHKFWAIEDVAESNEMSSEDMQCLQLYQSTTERQADGRYIVKLPLHLDIDEKLGQSKSRAVAQFYQLEKKFKHKEKLAKDYKLFIKEYYLLGHMQSVPSTTAGNKIPVDYYMPHHCVCRPDSTTTTLRVVYNASGKSSSGHSLNDLMYRGPNLQQDLLTLILRWRQYPFALTADIEKMYRQIKVHNDDLRYQKIVWRDLPTDELQDFQLTTVTYGTKAAPFLAMMTLRRLAQDEKHRFPAAAKVLEEQFYMDDLLSGHFTLESTSQLKSDLTQLLQRGGFNLRKWASNEPSLVSNNSSSYTFDFKHQESTKTLGLSWSSIMDMFTFQCKLSKKSFIRPTKRILLSEISKIFDPLGWLSPVTVQLKLLFQTIWTLDLQWDDEIPDEQFNKWIQLREDIESINQIRVPRWIGSGENDTIELHGFCDASTKAYAGVIYVRIHKINGISITLLASKTNIVPVNKSTSLPRLELCGAQLLAKLMTKVVKSLNSHKLQIYGWCDSTAVLGWLQGDPSKWKPFVANRVQKIIEVIPKNSWKYVKSNENPADCASRGLPVKQLLDYTLWWNGPSWLQTLNTIPQSQNFETELEIKKPIHSNTVQINTENTDVIQRILFKHSSFTRATRVLAWVKRAIQRKRATLFFLTADELRSAKLMMIKYVQNIEFQEDIEHIKKNSCVKHSSKIISLNPYLDYHEVLRVGGRLQNSNISDDMKHPLIIPHSNHLTDLLIDYAHQATFHGGARLTLAYLRGEYWIIGGNRAVKKRLNQCVICKRHSPIKRHQLMGDLPEARTNPTRPFYHTGVDFTGYVDVKANKGRGVKTTKGYIAVFICMATKAVHLELVSDLTSSAFLAALRRLAARRGTPGHLYSDNGTNFVGANKVLNTEFLNLKSILSNDDLAEISDMKINWHFNAPSWPSAGGLWEAAVKSLKFHLRRVVGEQKLTYEEFTTLLTQLEGCLNSRPLCAISEDPNDINYLTPSHFLSSGPVLTIYDTETDERTRWKLTQKIFNDIWSRWRAEYLAQISARSKWQEKQANVNIDDVVIIHDSNLPPGKWALARVVDTHPGKDGRVRVVSLKTKSGVIKRPIIKISPLPVNNQPKSVEMSSVAQTRKPSKKKTILNVMSTLLMFLALFTTSEAQKPYTITTLQKSNSIYFDKISDIHFIQDKWKLVVYYNMEPYWKGASMLRKYNKYLDSICSNFEKKVHCDTITLQLRHSLSELEYYDLVLRNPHGDKHSRTRRGLINGIGNIANSLFGVLDDQFAEQYEREINKIRINEKHLENLWKNQTSIIEAENNLLKRVENTMNTQHKVFKEHLSILQNTVSTLKEKLDKNELLHEFMLSSIIANNILTHLRSIQDTLLDSGGDWT